MGLLASISTDKRMDKLIGIKTGDVVKMRGGSVIRVVRGFNFGGPDSPYVDVIIECITEDDLRRNGTRYVDINDFMKSFEILEI